MEACQVTQALLLISLLGLLFLLPFLPAASAYLCLSFRVIFTAIAVVLSCCRAVVRKGGSEQAGQAGGWSVLRLKLHRGEAVRPLEHNT